MAEKFSVGAPTQHQPFTNQAPTEHRPKGAARLAAKTNHDERQTQKSPHEAGLFSVRLGIKS